MLSIVGVNPLGELSTQGLYIVIVDHDVFGRAQNSPFDPFWKILHNRCRRFRKAWVEVVSYEMGHGILNPHLVASGNITSLADVADDPVDYL